MTVSEIINRLEACVILARGWCLWWWKRCRSRCPLDDVGLIWTCWRLFAVCRWKANVFKSNVAQIARDFIMMVWVMCVGLSHGQHNNNSSIRKIRIYHHHHHHLFRPAIQNSSYKYQLTASRTVRLSLPITAHSLIQMSETRHTFHIHSIGLCDRFLEPGQWGEINFGSEFHTFTILSVKKLRRFGLSHCALYSLYGCPLVADDVIVKYLLTSRHTKPKSNVNYHYWSDYVALYWHSPGKIQWAEKRWSL